MSFKKIILLFLVCTVTVSCSDFLRGRKKNVKPIEVSGVGIECLKESPQKLSEYFEDKGTAESIAAVFSCFNESLVKFEKNTTGVDSDSYTGKEIQHFFNRYLLEENKISDGFRDQLLRLKVVLVGGKSDQISRDELKEIMKYNSLIGKELGQFSGFLKMLAFSNDEKFTENREFLKIQLKKSLTVLLDSSKVIENELRIEDIKKFIFEFDKFLNRDSGIRQLAYWMPVIESVKNLFVGKAPEFTKKDWEKSLDWSVDAYIKALQTKYEFSKLDFENPKDFKKFITYVDESLELAESSNQFRKHSKFELDAIDELVDQLWAKELIKFKMDAVVLKSSYRRAFQRFFGGPEEPESTEFSKLNFQVLKSEWQNYKVVQLDLIEYLSLQPNSSLRDYVRHLSKTNLKEWFELFKKNPLLLNDDIRIQIHKDVVNEKVSFKGLSFSNMIHIWIRFAMRGYGENTRLPIIKRELSETSLVNLEREFREMGRALQVLDPRQSATAPRRTLLEGNFFTFSGNGNKVLDSNETFELLHLMTSSSLRIAEDIRISLESKNDCMLSKNDEQGFAIANEICYKSMLRDKFSAHFQGLPGMLAMVSPMKTESWEKFYKKLQVASKDAGVSAIEIEQGGIRTMITVIQYVEVLFSVYDKDHDQMLSAKELLEASKRFRSFIGDVVKEELKYMCSDSKLYEKDWLVDNVFLYLVYKGTKPKAKDWSDIASHLWQKYITKLPDVDREQIINVLGILKSEMGGAKDATPPNCEGKK